MICGTHQAGTGNIDHKMNDDNNQTSWPSQDSDVSSQQSFAFGTGWDDDVATVHSGAHEPFTLHAPFGTTLQLQWPT
jgi:hypothetical protein